MRLLPLLFLLAVIGGIVTAVKMVARVLRCVDRAGSRVEHPMQFTIVDSLCLFFLLQLFMGVTYALIVLADVPRHEAIGIWVLNGFGCIAFVLTWGVSVRKLSRAGIVRTWHRTIFLAFVLPATFFGSICVPVAAIVFLMILIDGGGADSLVVLIIVLVEACSIAAIFLSGHLTRWILAVTIHAAETAQPDYERDDTPQ